MGLVVWHTESLYRISLLLDACSTPTVPGPSSGPLIQPLVELPHHRANRVILIISNERHSDSLGVPISQHLQPVDQVSADLGELNKTGDVHIGRELRRIWARLQSLKVEVFVDRFELSRLGTPKAKGEETVKAAISFREVVLDVTHWNQHNQVFHCVKSLSRPSSSSPSILVKAGLLPKRCRPRRCAKRAQCPVTSHGSGPLPPDCNPHPAKSKVACTSMS